MKPSCTAVHNKDMNKKMRVPRKRNRNAEIEANYNIEIQMFNLILFS